MSYSLAELTAEHLASLADPMLNLPLWRQFEIEAEQLRADGQTAQADRYTEAAEAARLK